MVQSCCHDPIHQPGQGILLSDVSNDPVGNGKRQRMGRTCSDTRRKVPGSHPLCTTIAFHGLTRRAIVLGNPPRTSRDTSPTSDTCFGIDPHQTILQVFDDGVGRTNGHAPGIFAMKAGPKGDMPLRFPIRPVHVLHQQHPGPHLRSETVTALTMQLAGTAGDASLRFMSDTVAAHR